ncbi:MAG: phytanoyl-CoA dioxygenase family protein [Novosphingobium sp.]|nr:phytanoyl-CoA dioxygenase family protein [Novosphingobium sp.]
MATNPDLGHYSPYKARFDEDGVVLIPGALNEAEMSLLEQCYESHFNADKQLAERMYGDGKDEIYFLTDNTIRAGERYQRLMAETRIADIAQDLFGGHDTYYYLEQMWNKTGGARRTAWHQDTAYIPFKGPGLVIFWIPLEPLYAENVLEVIRRSHKQTLFNAPMYDPKDHTEPLYDERDLPRIPNIENEREKWDIFSTPMQRGDVLAFHPGCIHGGAPTRPDQVRRSYTFRFFSDEAWFSPLPGKRDLGQNRFSNQRQDTDDRIVLKGFEQLKPGDLLCQSNEWERVRAAV